MADRYEARKGSQSYHCCFEWTVVDTHRPMGYKQNCHPMCECFDREEADLIANALNRNAGG